MNFKKEGDKQMLFNEKIKNNLQLYFRKNTSHEEMVIPYLDGAYWLIFGKQGEIAVERIDKNGYAVRTTIDVNWKYNSFDKVNEAIENAIIKVESFKKKQVLESYATRMIVYHI